MSEDPYRTRGPRGTGQNLGPGQRCGHRPRVPGAHLWRFRTAGEFPGESGYGDGTGDRQGCRRADGRASRRRVPTGEREQVLAGVLPRPGDGRAALQPGARNVTEALRMGVTAFHSAAHDLDFMTPQPAKPRVLIVDDHPANR